MSWLVRSALSSMYPRTGDLPGVEDCDLRTFLARMRRESPRIMWIGLWLGTLVYHLTPLFTVFVPLPAFLLPTQLRDKHTYKLTTTHLYLIRQSTLVLKLAAGLCWGADPKVRAKLGLPALPSDPTEWRVR